MYMYMHVYVYVYIYICTEYHGIFPVIHLLVVLLRVTSTCINHEFSLGCRSFSQAYPWFTILSSAKYMGYHGTVYSLVNIQKTMENHHFQWVNPLQMAIFNSYVKLPEGNWHNIAILMGKIVIKLWKLSPTILLNEPEKISHVSRKKNNLCLMGSHNGAQPRCASDPPNRSALDPIELARRPSCSCSAPEPLHQTPPWTKMWIQGEMSVTKKDWISPKRLDYDGLCSQEIWISSRFHQWWGYHGM